MNDSGQIPDKQYTLISKWQVALSVLLTLVALIASGWSAFSSGIRRSDLTFDSQKQKHEVLISTKNGHPISAIEAMHVKDHRENPDVHMRLEEKNNLIRIEESLKILTRDVAEIKELLKKSNN